MMSDKISAQEYQRMLEKQAQRGGGKKRRSRDDSAVMTVDQVRAQHAKKVKEVEIEDLCVQYLEIHGWKTSHHDPFQQAGPPLRLSKGQAEQLRASGVPVLIYGSHVPTYLPIRPVRDEDRAWPDRMCLHPRAGKLILIEFKRPGEKPRPDQKALLELCPGMSFWCDGLDSLQRELAARNLPGGQPL